MLLRFAFVCIWLSFTGMASPASGMERNARIAEVQQQENSRSHHTFPDEAGILLSGVLGEEGALQSAKRVFNSTSESNPSEKDKTNRREVSQRNTTNKYISESYYPEPGLSLKKLIFPFHSHL